MWLSSPKKRKTIEEVRSLTRNEMDDSVRRTRNYWHQVSGSFLFKLLAVVASLVAVPITLHWLGAERYGIWSTLLSILMWIVFFDFGIGNGLRNQVTRYIATGSKKDAQDSVSTAYVVIAGLCLVLFLVFFVVSSAVSWQQVFRSRTVSESELLMSVRAAAFFIFLNFWLGLATQVLNGAQATAWVVLGQVISNLCALVIVYISSVFLLPKVWILALAYGVAVLFSNIVMSTFVFRRWNFLFPRLTFSTKMLRQLLDFGLKIFSIQIVALIIFNTDRILITQYFGPSSVVDYDITTKVFSIVTIAQTMLTSPLWAAYGDAYHKGDWQWIRGSIYKQTKIFGILSALVVLLAVFFPIIIHYWLGGERLVSWQMVLSVALLVLIMNWNNIFSYCLNGLERTRVQLITAGFALAVFFPLSWFLVQVLGFGSFAIPITMLLCLSFFAVAGSVTVFSMIRSKVS